MKSYAKKKNDFAWSSLEKLANWHFFYFFLALKIRILHRAFCQQSEGHKNQLFCKHPPRLCETQILTKRHEKRSNKMCIWSRQRCNNHFWPILTTHHRASAKCKLLRNGMKVVPAKFAFGRGKNARTEKSSFGHYSRRLSETQVYKKKLHGAEAKRPMPRYPIAINNIY